MVYLRYMHVTHKVYPTFNNPDIFNGFVVLIVMTNNLLDIKIQHYVKNYTQIESLCE